MTEQILNNILLFLFGLLTGVTIMGSLFGRLFRLLGGD